jgi:hypothetical protein
MFGWFRKRSSSAADDPNVIALRAGEPFAWPTGATLTALEEATLALNALAHLGSEESIGSLLSGPDAMQVAAPFGGEWVLLRMMPGMAVTALRACEVSLSEAEGTTRRFRLTGASRDAAPETSSEGDRKRGRDEFCDPK